VTAQWTSTRQIQLGMNTPPIVSPEDWEAALRQMLAEEKEQMLAEEKAQMRAGDALAAERRRMPWMAVESPNGKLSPTALENHSRALSHFLIAFCGGVAATLACWSYGDAARQMIANSYPQLLLLAPPRALTASEAPNMIVPYSNPLDAMLREPHTMRQSLDRVAAGQEFTRNTDQTTTSVDQAPSAQADGIPIESRGDAASLQPTVPLNIEPTEAKALQTLSEKRKQLAAAGQHDASCFPSASAVLQNHPGGRPTWTLRAPGHEGTQCWYAAARPRVSDHRPTEGQLR
jgi:hypothetical protein